MKDVTVHKVGIIMNGVTGRMGTNQHLLRSICEIIKSGGTKVNKTELILPDPVLVGRNPDKLKALSAKSGVEKWTTDVDSVLGDSQYTVYFDSQTTDRRVEGVSRAIEAGKHIYCEKPTALTAKDAYRLYTLAKEAGVKHGVVQDKLWLPGFLKIKSLIDKGFFGRIFCVKGDFGYWVFEGDRQPSQRPSWNYRKEDGGGIIMDMFCHWRYVLDNLFGSVKAVSCLGAAHIKKRWDEGGQPYECTAEDAAYATFELEDDITAQFNSSWSTRVHRDDLLTVQVDGTKGSAVAGLRRCVAQSYEHTPRPIWNPDIENPIDFYDGWSQVKASGQYDNAFKTQWELYLKYIVKDEPFRWDLLEGARGVQLGEKGIESWQKRAWVDIPELKR